MASYNYFPQYAKGNPYGNLGPSPATVRGLLPKKTKKKAAPSKAASPSPIAIPGQISQSDALAQVMQSLQPIFDAQDARINAAYDAQQRAVQQAYEALAKYGQGVGPAIQNAYQGAAKDTAAFGKGFSDAVTQLSSGHANDATAAIAAQGGPQTVTSGLANGGGDALYAMGGAIPGSQLEREGAAFTSAASFLPNEAAGLGAGAISNLGQQRIQDLLGVETDRPQTIMDAVNKLLDESYSRQQDALKLAGKTTTGSSASSAKPQLRSLANGQIGTYLNGKLVSVSGPPKAASASSVKLQARSLANGQVQWFDPTTGRAVGKPVGPPRQKGKGSAPSNKLQARSLANGQIQWFNPRTGKPVGAPVGPPRVKSSGSTGASASRPYDMTPTQIRRAKGDAYQIAQAWSKNGMKDGDGNPVKAQDLLKDMINAGQIPFDIAVRALAKFYAPAKKWYNPKKKTSNVSNVTEIQDSPGYEPSKGVVQLPTHFVGTHVTDGLGWGTKTAHDFMAPVGAPVLAPVSGTILYFHPTGAQGGGSMMIRGDDGYEYWLGHIENGIPGGRINAGEQIAQIANQSVSAPHVHIDRRPLGASV